MYDVQVWLLDDRPTLLEPARGPARGADHGANWCQADLVAPPTASDLPEKPLVTGYAGQDEYSPKAGVAVSNPAGGTVTTYLLPCEKTPLSRIGSDIWTVTWSLPWSQWRYDGFTADISKARSRSRGEVEELPSGSLRVRVDHAAADRADRSPEPSWSARSTQTLRHHLPAPAREV
jgi:hypothetical protein